VTLAAAFLLPGVAAIVLWLWRPPAPVSRRATIAVAALLVLLALRLLVLAGQGEIAVHGFGSWRPPYGVVFAVDRLSALFIALHAVLLLLSVVILRASAHGELALRRAHPLLMLATMGLVGAFATGDLFNLFVMFELVLVCSYVLLQVPGSGRSVAAALPVVVINLVASLLFLAGLGLLYGICGSLNLADLIAQFPSAPASLRRAALAMLVVAFGTKAALVPLCFWMPASYPTLCGPVAALFAGIMTKLGVYALLRILPLLRADALVLEILVWAGALSALLGVLAALSQYEMRRLLAFHSVSQVGYMVLGLGLASTAGIAGAIFFALHHSLVKSTLYFVADELERRNSSRDLRAMHPNALGSSLLAPCFGVAAFALAGLPPFSGFFGKLAVFRAGIEDERWVGLALLLLASVFTLASMLKIWHFAFHTRAGGASTTPRPGLAEPRGLLAAAGLVLAMSFAAGPVYRYAEAAAADLVDPAPYSEAVRAVAGHPLQEEGRP